MLKKSFFLWMMLIAFVFTGSMALLSCDDDPNKEGNGNGENPPEDYDIVGVYTYGTYTWTFNANKTYEITRESVPEPYTGTWSVSGNEIILTDTSPQYAALTIIETFTITENDNQVTFSYSGQVSKIFIIFDSMENSLTFTKQSGGNNNGGNGNNGGNAIPFLAKQVYTGSYHTVAIGIDGSLWAWGRNSDGQLGDGTFIDKNTPVRIGSDTDWALIFIDAGYTDTTYAIKTNGSLWAWGNNLYGGLMNGTNINKNTPSQIGSESWKSINCTYNGTLDGIKTNGTLWQFWWKDGGIYYYQLLTNTYTDTNWAIVGYNFAIKADGSLWFNFGSSNSKPMSQVGTENNWASFDSSSSAYVIKNDGSLWKTGYGTIVNRIGSETWVSVSLGANNEHNLAIKTNGSLWAWGTEYGKNEIDDAIQIGSATNWKSIFAGFGCSFAIKTDGTLWAWGGNGFGQCGISPDDDNYIDVPTQVFIYE